MTTRATGSRSTSPQPRQFRVRAWRTGHVDAFGIHVPAGGHVVVQLDPAAPKGQRVDHGTLAQLGADPRLEVDEIAAPLDGAAAPSAPSAPSRNRRPPAGRT